MGRTAQVRPAAAATAVAREPSRPRPLLVPAIALIVGICVSETIGPVAGAARAALFAVPPVAFALLLVLLRRETRGQVVLSGLVAVIALTVGFTRHQSVIYRPRHHIACALGDEPVLTRLAGRVVTAPVTRPAVKHNPFMAFDPSPRTQFVLAVEELRTTDPSTPVVGNVRVSIETGGLGLRLGQRVQLTGRLYRPRGPRNPGERDWAQWYRRQGIDAGMVVEGSAHVAKLSGPGSRWHRLVATVRGTARSLLFEPYADLDADQSVRLLDVMVLGQRSAADQKLNEAFLRAGGMHFLAVSGFHVGVLAGAAWWVVRRGLRCSRRVAALTMLLLTVLYALVAEPNAPILRATTVVALVALATMTRRPICVINWLALAAGCVLLVNPLEVFRPGFQLSFVLVTALVTIVPPVYRVPFGRRADDAPPPEAQTLAQLVWLKIGRWLGGLAIVCLCAWVVALPLVALHFGRFALWGWLGTFLLSPLVVLTVVLSFTTLVANALLPALGVLLGVSLRWATGTLLSAVGLFEHLPGAVVELQPPPVWLVMATYGGLIAWAARRRPAVAATNEAQSKRARRYVVSGVTLITVNVIALLGLSWLGWLVLPSGQRGAGYTLHVLAVGNGNTILLATPQGRAAVLDVGTNTNSDAGQTAARALRALGIRRVDAAIVSHANFDHYSGLPTLIRRVPVGRWLTNPYFAGQTTPDGALGRLLERLPTTAPAPAVLRSGDQLALGDVALEVLWPPDGLGDAWAANDRSLVMRLSAAGRTVLLTGDIERDAISALLEAEREGRISLRADVLIAPHHGSVLKDVTADFYAAVSPAVVVVSTRTPRPKLTPLVQDALGPGARVVFTGQVGAVVVRITSDGRLAVETPYTPSSGG